MKQIKEQLKKINKKYLIGIVSIVMIACVGSAFTWSYYHKDLEVKVNAFASGNVETHIEEEFQAISMTSFAKNPRIVNTGRNDCYVRIRLTMSPANAVITTNYRNTGEKNNWVYNKEDGFYYYTKVLASGNTELSTTTDLFTEIQIENPQDVDGFHVDVYQEAVQAEAYLEDGSVLTSYEDIWKLYDQH